MKKNKFTIFLLIAVLCFTNIYAQYNNVKSVGIAPLLPFYGNNFTNSVFTNPYSLGYSYYAVGTTGSQLFRYKVGTPGSTTLIGTTKPYILGSGDFANPTGVWKFYVQDQNLPYTIYEVDTATGSLINVGAPVNLRSGHKPTDFEWDQTTNSFYMISSDTALTETQLYRMYWPTKELTWVGPPATTPSTIVAGGFNSNGTYFGIDIGTASLWKVNKNTGAWALVGSLGYPVNFSQDAGFDRSDYSRMLWCASGGTVGLYEIDTSNANINLIGAFPPYTQVLATGFIGGQCGPQISTTPYGNIPNQSGPYIINATVIPCGAGIAYTRLFWSRNNTVITDSINMTNAGGNNWTGSIPGNGNSAVYRYYCLTKDSLNKTATAPIGAPANVYSFLALATDTSKPVITHTPISNTSKDNWPASLTATVIDNYGIDSVWVKWRRNSNTTKQFKLTHTGTNTYTSLFNSVNSEVFVGDTIYYRIIAQDSSSNHNKDSTQLYYFTITPGVYACIGNGTINIASGPYNTSYYGNRTQMLWTAQELLAGGGSASFITKIGFNIGIVHTIVMNNFSVKMQYFYDTAIGSFINDNWTMVYADTYSVPGTGWQYITLQNPFEWDGVSNLLVEICYENQTNSMYSTVLGYSTSANKFGDEAHDLSSACSTFQNPGIGYIRPNVCFKFELLNNNNNNNSNTTPDNYSLSQNYPNPFNPVTRICFNIPKQSFVSLKVFNILGEAVSVLASGRKSAGQYSVDFNAACLPSGIYFYRLETDGYIATKRMILIK
jgi:hypothetical protein